MSIKSADDSMKTQENPKAASIFGATQRSFHGIWGHILNLGFVFISVFIIYTTVNLIFDVVIKRSLFLMVIFVLCAVFYPFSTKERLSKLSVVVDIVVILLSVAGSIYVMRDYESRFLRMGLVNTYDLVFGICMVLIGLEIGRRVIGWALPSVAIVVLLYAFLGNYIPGRFGHPGFEIGTVVSEIYCGMNGYYGMATKAMILYVVPFILFGAFLEKTGATEFFMNLAFSLTLRTTGGPAKAAVLGSGLIGSISGSAIANVSSTGVLTIPMMKKMGYKPHVAAAIEAAASTAGQITPPIMGAAAFIMVEFTQIPYLHICAIAAVPILLYYLTVFVFVHIESKKSNIKTVSDTVYSFADTLKKGWHFIFSIVTVILVMLLGFPPNIAAMSGLAVTVIAHILRSRRLNLRLYYEALVMGGRNSLTIGSVIACIGIILALVGLTGLGLKLSWLLSALSKGNAILAIIMVGLISLVLGMGLPSTVAYIVMAISSAPALMAIGFPLLSAHMIILWLSIDSEITPPIGLASIVGAGIAGADPMKTMFTAFKYAKGLYILPVMFYYRPEVLFLGDSVFLIKIETVVSILFGLITFCVVLENFMFKKLHIAERLILALAALGLFLPGLLWNLIGFVIFVVVALNQKVGVFQRIRVGRS